MKGGICGTAFDSTINNCSNICEVRGSSELGGISGCAEGYTTISNCYNIATIQGTGIIPVEWNKLETNVDPQHISTCTGGITGMIYHGAYKAASINFINCYNRGNIQATNYYAGGIYGASQGSGESVNMTNCYNTGIITARDNTCGTVLGYGVGVVVSNCYSSYDIKGAGEGSGFDWGNSRNVSANELKGMASTLGSAYKTDTGINAGFPILSWQ